MGPFGITKLLVKATKNISNLQSGAIYNYAFIIFISAILYITYITYDNISLNILSNGQVLTDYNLIISLVLIRYGISLLNTK
jgi:hypothetical protein